MMSREALARVGLFDEEFFQVHEDIDWSTRALSLGYRVVYVDTTAVYHKGAGSADHAGSTGFNYGYLLGRNSILFARKHATGSQWIKLLAMMTAGLALRVGVGVLKRILFTLPGHANYVRAVVDGFAGRLRLEYAFPRTLLDGRLAYHQVDPPWA
jgi:GT2 family glycosyltransferase